jgi:hypothetical protein
MMVPASRVSSRLIQNFRRPYRSDQVRYVELKQHDIAENEEEA